MQSLVRIRSSYNIVTIINDTITDDTFPFELVPDVV